MTKISKDGGSVLLVGGSSDLGVELARALAGEEMTIIAHHHSSLGKLKQLSEHPGLRLAPVQADLADAGQVRRFIDRVAKDHGTPEAIVHFAAPKAREIYFKDSTWEDFEAEMRIQVRSITMILREFLPKMAARKSGKVVFVLTSYTLGVPPLAQSHYLTAKYALLGLMRSLAAEYSRHGLSINAVSPSMMQTAFLHNLEPRMVEIIGSQSPRGRNATPQDVVPAIQFLLSPGADYITGANLPIAGGTTF